MKIKILVKSKTDQAVSGTTLFEKEGALCVIGRKDADLRLPHTSCSRQHAILFQAPDGKLALRDLGSTNGTFVNKKKVTESAIAVGDEIIIGRYVLAVIEYEPSQAEAAQAIPLEGEIEGTGDTLTGAYTPDTKSDVIVDGNEKFFQCLPQDAQNKFVDYVDSTGVHVRSTLNDLLKARKK